ncbi:MAG TPA: FUSC family protein [Aliidongia sp.]|nr:FUSC family protein [Aliidongia sp.]
MHSVAAPEPTTAKPAARLDGLGDWALASIAGWVAPKLLHGLRLWGAVCLALYLAFWLELDNPYWAGMSAVIVCQPSLGASLRKSSYRLFGTIVGAAFAVVLAACFPQSRLGFMAGLAIWGGACAFVATVLRDYASYGAALAGYTTAIIGAGALGATGGIGSEIFTIAILRASEISVGIVSASLVVAATSIGSARRTLLVELCHLTNDATRGLADAYLETGTEQAASRPRRHVLVSRVIAISPLVENAIGEEYDLRHSRSVLRSAAAGLVSVMSGWRTAANCLEPMAADEGMREGAIVRQLLPRELLAGGALVNPANWHAQGPLLRQGVIQAVRALERLPAETPSLRLMADGAAEALLGLVHILDGITLLDDPLHHLPARRSPGRYIPDLLPAVLSATRTAIAIGAVEALWIVTAWPSGPTAIAFAALSIILFSPRGDLAYLAAKGFMLGGSYGIGLALAFKFGVLPACAHYESTGIALALVFVPLGMLATVPSVAAMSSATAVLFVRVLEPENQMSYDAESTWNLALAIFIGILVAKAAMSLFPSLSPEARASRAARGALRDLRRLALEQGTVEVAEWEHRSYRRLADLPPTVDTLVLARCVAALSLGSAILRLRRIADRSRFRIELEQALHLLGHGRREEAIGRLAQLDRQLSEAFALPGRPAELLRALGNVRLISATLTSHAEYFDRMGAT